MHCFTGSNNFAKKFCDSYLFKNKDEFKRLLTLHIDFIKKADKINNNYNNVPYVCDKKFYNDQADYIQKLCSEWSDLMDLEIKITKKW